jgi:hypothetical protein
MKTTIYIFSWPFYIGGGKRLLPHNAERAYESPREGSSGNALVIQNDRNREWTTLSSFPTGSSINCNSAQYWALVHPTHYLYFMGICSLCPWKEGKIDPWKSWSFSGWIRSGEHENSSRSIHDWNIPRAKVHDRTVRTRDSKNYDHTLNFTVDGRARNIEWEKCHLISMHLSFPPYTTTRGFGNIGYLYFDFTKLLNFHTVTNRMVRRKLLVNI